ncbi:MAG TPA: SDR family oxidoreductase [Spirochaetia bacterium]|nr:SDR family oxidoreductase [Spirochaetia bacterium]
MKGTGILEGRTAVVTGASSGLGADFSRELASRGAGLVLVARRADRLESLRGELASRHGVRVEVIPMDLVPADAPQRLHDEVSRRGLAVDILVNNAGFGLYGKFLEVPWERERSMIELDILSLTAMTRLFAPDMVSRGFGRILEVSSIGAFQPSPTYAAYSAAKSYVLSFGEALAYELRGTGVSCTVICPGVTATEFLSVAGQSATAFQRSSMMKSADVARIGIEALLAGTSSVVPGFMNAFLAWSTRFLSRRAAAAMANRFMS